MNTKYPTTKSFMNKLEQTSSDVGNKIGKIKRHSNMMKLNNIFAKNPYEKDSKGNLRFKILEHGFKVNTEENLLELFSEPKDLLDYMNSTDVNFSITETKTDTLLADYQLPNILHIYADTNILLDPAGKSFLKRIGNIEGVTIDNLPIVKQEAQRGGIQRKYGNNVPEGIYRGQKMLEQRCDDMTSALNSEFTILYDIVLDYFNEHEKEINLLANSKWDPKDLAQEFASNQTDEYKRMIAKTIEHVRNGNAMNHLADRIITTTNFGFNLLQDYRKSLVISNDQDLLTLQESFYDNILPKYMAETVHQAAIKRDPTIGEKLTKDDWPNASKEHIVWARDYFSNDNTTIGLLYMPRTNEFAIKEVASALRQYFCGVEEYRHAKSNLITEMALSGEKPEAIIKRLIEKPEQYNPSQSDNANKHPRPDSPIDTIQNHIRPSERMDQYDKDNYDKLN